MPNGATVKQLGVGEDVVFVVLTNGNLASWGYSAKGLALNGLSTTVTEYGPRVRNTTSIGPIASIASRGRGAAAHVVAQSGKVYTWGDGAYGLLGKS
jgi:alpha-tubulin suppressor-like RCC1 family protein